MLAATSGERYCSGTAAGGADASNKYKSSGETALMLAQRNGHIEITQMLKEGGASG
jgi:ankyrin repeat protein